MPDYEALKAAVQELAGRDWDRPAIEARFSALAQEGIPRKTLDRDQIVARKGEILARVQRRGEEYEYLSIFGSYLDPRASAANFEAFRQARGYAKCALLPGIGARIAAQIIIESMEGETG